MRGDITDAGRTTEDRATQPMEAGGWVSQLGISGLKAGEATNSIENRKCQETGKNVKSLECRKYPEEKKKKTILLVVDTLHIQIW